MRYRVTMISAYIEKQGFFYTRACIMVLAMVLFCGVAMGQRDNGGGNGGNATNMHVTVGGNVFGGGNLAPVAGNSSVILNQTGAVIGTRNNAGTLTENTGDVYGGGALANVGTNSGNTTTVDILDGIVEGNVYGGGLGDSIGNGYFSQFGRTESVAALVYGKVTVNIGAEPVNSNSMPTGNATLKGDVFGCNNVNGTPKDDVRVNIWKTAHTENNKYPIDNDGHLTVTLGDLNVADPDATSYNNKFAINAVYGGGNKASYVPNSVTSGNPHSTSVYIYGCEENTVKTVYGGGNAANVGTNSITANTNILIDGGRFDRVFGGGNGYSADGNHDKPYKDGDVCTTNTTDHPCSDYNPGANIYGTASTTITGGLYRQVFGGSNQCGNLNEVALVIDNACDTLLIFESFGGANEAEITADVATTLLCSDYVIGNFYGGSNKADINGSVTLNVRGGTYSNVFGGSKGTTPTTNTPEAIAAASADIAGNVTLNLHGGTMVNAFGGSDVNGRIKGYITVNVWDTVAQCPLQVDTIYGGGQEAAYAPDSISGKKIVSPVVNLWHGTVGHTANNVTTPGCVFGGGKGAGAKVTAHPKVMIGDTISDHTPNNQTITVLGHVFGGGNAAPVDGIDSVLMLNANSVVSNLFGGGNQAYADSAVVIMNVAATVDTIFGGGNLAGLGDLQNQTGGYALVDVSAGTVHGGIYGGSNKSGSIYGDITVNVTGGTVGSLGTRANIHGGGYGNATASTGDVTVNFGAQNSNHQTTPALYGDLYGGSGFGNVNASGKATTVNVINGEITGDVYGGGLGSTSPSYPAAVNGNVEVNIGKYIGSDTPILYNHAVFNTYDDGNKGGNVFGCNNANGAPQGTVTVNVNGNVTNNVYGGGNLAAYANEGNNYPEVNISNGTVSNVFGGGLGSSAQVTGNPQVTVGEDSGSNTATVTNNVYGGGQQAPVVGNTMVLMQHANSSATKIFGGGQAASVSGTATVTVDNGTINASTEAIHNGVYGGCDNSGNVGGLITVNINNGVFGENAADKKVYIHGGGYGSSTTTGNSILVNVGDGTTTPAIYGDVYGGSALGAVNVANSLTKVWLKSGSINGTLYGGGMGGANDSTLVRGNVQVDITTTGSVTGGVYGGCNFKGGIGGDIDINVNNGTIGVDGTPASIHGGGFGNATATSGDVTVNFGEISDVHSSTLKLYGDIYGGSGFGHVNAANDTTTVNILNGEITGDVYGGGLGQTSPNNYAALVNGKVFVNIGQQNTDGTYSGKATLGGNVFGCNNANGSPQDSVFVNIYSTHHGNNPAANAYPTDISTLEDLATNSATQTYAINAVYGGGNLAPYTPTLANNKPRSATVHVYGCKNNTIEEVYGGGNAADVGTSSNNANTFIVIDGGRINRVFGGGKGDNTTGSEVAANIHGTATTTINAGLIDTIFGGGNMKGSIDSISLILDHSGSCTDELFNQVYGGANLAELLCSLNTTIKCGVDSIGDIYGGSNLADIKGDVTLNIKGGKYHTVFGGSKGASGNGANIKDNLATTEKEGNVTLNLFGGEMVNAFGGSNVEGNIEGLIVVNVLDTVTGCSLQVDTIYGGGQDAAYTPTVASSVSPVVNLLKGTVGHGSVPGCVFGGGKGATATVTANPTVYIGDLHNAYVAAVTGNVYGGGNLAKVSGNTVVTIQKNSGAGANTTISHNVYGGGNQANVSGSTTVNVTGGTVTEDVYGGGALAHVNVTDSGEHTEGANTSVTLSDGIVRMVFGGGMGDSSNEALVYGNTEVTIEGGTINGNAINTSGASVKGGVFGGCNVKGTVKGGATVDITAAVGAENNHVNIYGGGLGANTNVQGAVAVTVATEDNIVYGDIYGGSAKGLVNYAYGSTSTPSSGDNIATVVTLTSGTVTGDIYGGGHGLDDASANVGREVTVAIEGGSVNTYGNNDSKGGNVFGCNNVLGTPIDTVNVNITGGIMQNVFGGGNLSNKTGKGVAVTYNTEANATNSHIDTIFGGGNMAGVSGNAKVIMAKGQVNKGIYGGCNASGNIGGKVTVNVNGGSIGSQSSLDNLQIADIYGGGFGANTSTSGNVEVNIEGGSIYGNVYGGSALGTVNTNGNNTTIVNVLDGTLVTKKTQTTAGFTVYNGGNVFGGGLGVDNTSANAAKGKVNGKVTVNIGGPSVSPSMEFRGNATIGGSVYGCNNTGGSPQDLVTVNIYRTALSATDTAIFVNPPTASKTYAISNVFGGGNQANFTPANGKKSIVNVFGCENTIERIFGGGNAAAADTVYTNIQGGRIGQVFGGGNGEVTAANIHGNVYLGIHGGLVGQFFGGSNSSGNISGEISIAVDNTSGCDTLNIDEFFCGGNFADIIGGLETTIDCSEGMHVNNLYGGCNMADIYGDVVLNLEGGEYINVYGGSKGRLADAQANVTAKPANILKYPSDWETNNSYPPALKTYMQQHGGNTLVGQGGNVTLNLYGGTMTNAFGGSNVNGNIEGVITVNLLDATSCPLQVDTIYGSGCDAAYTPVDVTTGVKPVSPIVNINHGTVGHAGASGNPEVAGCVFGGGKGTTAIVTANPKVIIGDNESTHTATVLGNVFGGGNAAAVIGIDTVKIQKTSSTAVNLFGGGNAASAGSSVVLMEQGVVDTIFGGGNLAGLTGTSKIVMTNGKVNKGIFGGCNASGTVSGIVTLEVNGGAVGAENALAYGIFGGGYGAGTSTANAVNVTIGNGTATPTVYGDIYGGSAKGNVNAGTDNLTKVWIKKGEIHGDIYGGGFGDGEANALVKGNVEVQIDGGTLYTVTNGGGRVFGCNNLNGTPQGTVTVTVNTTDASTTSGDTKVYALKGVYGGGNQANYVPTDDDNGYPKVIIGCNTSIEDVFGGANAAAVPQTDVTINGGDLKRVFAGGNGTSGSAHVGYNTKVTPAAGDDYGLGTASALIKGGTILEVFGGSNSSGLIRANGELNVAKVGDCAMHIGDVYGGGNLADGAPAILNIGCTGSETEGINNVYGGANNAAVTGDIELNIVGGRINNVFGGNNNGGAISGTITVNVEWDNELNCGTNGKYLGNVYGGGNLAAYTYTGTGNYPEVNIKNGTISQNVFGGGLGASAKVRSNPKVTVGDISEGHSGYQAIVSGNVYGGGSMAMVGDDVQASASINNTSVILQKANSSVSKVFGGGAQAGVTGTTGVTIADGSVTGGVYGGCDDTGTVGGNITVDVTGGTIGADDANSDDGVFGGGFGNGTSTSGNVSVTIKGSSVDVYGDVYGGSAKGSVNNASTNNTIVTLASGTVHGDLYGGGLGDNTYAAAVNGGVQVAVYGGTVANVFGCNNENGAPQSTVQVIVNDTTAAQSMAVTNVFGGGNLAVYDGNPKVFINNGTVSGNVYGGGNGDPNDNTQTKGSTGVPTVTVGDLSNNSYQAIVLGDVYGGGNAAKVTGTNVADSIYVQKCNTQINYVYGGGNAANVPATFVKVMGGTIDTIFGGGHGDNTTGHEVAANVNGNDTISITGGTIKKVFAGSNLNGSITGRMALNIDKGSNGCDMKIGEAYGGGNMAAGKAGAITVGCTGTWTDSHDTHNSTTNRIGYELEGIGTVYGGANQAGISNDITLNINSGIVENVFGGNNTSGEISGTITVNIEKTGDCDWYVGDVYGGGNHAPYGGTPDVNIVNGTVSGNVYGGGNDITEDSSSDPKGVAGSDVEMTGGTVLGGIYGGCNLKGSVTGNSLVKVYGGTVGSSSGTRADVFGGGLGQNTKVLGNVTLNVNKTGENETNIYGDVYGGSAKGLVNCTGAGNAQNADAKTDVTVTLGTIFGNLYGGGLGESGEPGIAANVWGPVTVKVNGGTVNTYTVGTDVLGGSVYGCNNYKGSPQISTLVEINDGEVVRDVYGGGNLADAAIATHVKVDGGTVGRDVYGGGAYANTGATTVDILAGIVTRDVYGGGLGRKAVGEVGDEGYVSPIEAKVNGTVTVNIGSGTMEPAPSIFTASTTGSATIGGSVYGCNNAAGSPQDNVTVNVYATAHPSGTLVNETGFAIANVFGGGNEADFMVDGKTTKVNIYGCDNTIGRTFGGGNAAATNTVYTMIQGGRIGQVFGGGNGEVTAANINGNVYLGIHGGYVGQFFGGSNQNGAISGNINPTIDDSSPCPGHLEINEFFCGGNFADIIGGLTIDITCSEDMTVNNLYGGCNMANIWGDVQLNLYGGTYINVFGGSKGDLEALNDPANNITGHINKAANILRYPASDYNWTSNPNGYPTALQTYMNSHSTLAGTAGNVTLNLYGGTMTNAFGGSNVNGNIEGKITVNVLDNGGNCGLEIHNIYGGSNVTAYTPNYTLSSGENERISPVVNLIHGTVSTITDQETGEVTGGNVFGGSKGGANATATVTASPKVNIGYDATTMGSLTTESTLLYNLTHGNTNYTSTTQPADFLAAVGGKVFGGGDAAPVSGNTEVIMQKANTSVLKDIYGGGNLANVSGSTTVNVNGGIVTQDVYGGGALADVNVTSDAPTPNATTSVTLGGGTVRNLYGGGLGSRETSNVVEAKVYGPVTVTVNSGTVTNVFGCNNENGAPQGTVIVDINNNVTNSVYGGGNLAACSVSPAVRINKGTVGGSVFGGGLGSSAIVTGTPTVTVGDVTDGHEGYVAVVTNDVYGGGDAANVKGTTTVLVQKCNTIINGDVYGGGNAADIAKNEGVGGSTNVTVTGGAINSTNANHGNVFGGGHGNQSTNTSANVEGNTLVAINGGTIKRVFGGSNSKGDIGGSTSVNVEKDDDACDLHITEVYGGGNEADGKAGLVTIVCTGDGANEGVGDVYGGARAAGVSGDITLNITGGKIDNVFGGNNISGIIDGKITVNVDWGTDCDNNSLGNVYGGGNQAAYSSPMTTGENPVHTNYPEVNILNGTVSTNVFGGGLGEDALVTGNPVVNINGGTVTGSTFGGGSAAPVTGNPTVNAKKGNATTVFGGGWGATAVVNGNPIVVANQTSGESLNVTDVYGGGDQAEVEGNTDVQLMAGSITNAFGGGNVANIIGTTSVSLEGATVANIYGGGNQANVSSTTNVSVSSGSATTGVYGGCNTSGVVEGDITVSLTGGTIGADGAKANVHGGGYGQQTKTGGNVEVTINQQSGDNPPAAPVIWGDVYGGSALGSVNSSAATPAVNSSSHTSVTLTKGTIHGDIYGGGLGQTSPTSIEAKVWSPVQVTINGGTVTGSVYGCNNANGAPQSTVKVDVYGTDAASSGSYALGHVFGGGNQATYTGIPVVKVHNCNNSIEYVYGGGNAANVKGTDVTVYGGNSIAHVFGGCYGADVTNDGTDVKIYGGTIDTIYGGNNESGTVTGNIKVTVNKTADTDPNGSSTACEMHIKEVYGGGNKADSHAGQITIGCTGEGNTEGIQYVYGGANRANVTGPINLKIEEGRIANVFGGNNNSGSITDAITVTIEKKASPCVWDIGNVFGGGNLAQYEGTPIVYVKNGAVANVYGGGNGDPDDDSQELGQVTGTNVTIGDANTSYSAVVTGNVYGGGNAAKVSGNTQVVYNDSNTTSSVGNLFGGGNQAGVTGTTQVTLTDGTVTTGVYGGCNEKGNIGGKVTVNVSGGTIGSLSNLQSSTHTTADVFGGGYGQQTSTSNDVEVNVGEQSPTAHSDFPMIYGDVYGGSAFGEVNSASASPSNTTTVNIHNGTLYSVPGTVNGFTVYYGGNVYGGGLGRKAVGEVGDEGYVSPIEAKVNGLVTVNVGSGTVTSGFTPSTNTGEATIKGNVYGCNNTNGSPQQNVTVNIFKTAHTTTDTYNYDPTQNGNVPATYALANVFGGGNEADFRVNEKKATVNVYGCDNTIRRTFGGSNAAASNEVFTMIQGGRILEAFGGGNGEVKPANVFGNVNLAIHGGSIGQSFGGSNQQGTISGSSNVTVDSQGGCGEAEIEEYFCGGNFANFYGDINATIECADGLHIKNLYGGCKQADVLPNGQQIGNVHLVVKGGTYENIFGGSQGRLEGTDPEHPDAESADISGHILLEIFGGKVTNAIYGGSHILGDVRGTITVNIENKNTGCQLDLSEADVYGGGNQADYKTPTVAGHSELHDYPQVNIKNATVKNVFGGGLQAEVKGNPQIRIKKGSKVLGNVYGGGNLGVVDGDPRVIVNGKDESDNPTNSLDIELPD